MANKKRKIKKTKTGNKSLWFFVIVFPLFSATGFGIYHFVNAQTQSVPVEMHIDPNIGIQAIVEEFFNANDAPEMIPIIKCESEFKHYNSNGTILKNSAGSSATGVTQILSSVHPDPKIVYRYNKRNQTDLKVEDLDIMTLEGNLGYALMLYTIRGTQDWECAKKFRFN